MRRLLLAALVVMGCSSATAPVSIIGTWSDQASTPAGSAPMLLTLTTQTGTSVSGMVTIVGLPDTSYDISGTYHSGRIRVATAPILTNDHSLSEIVIDGTAASSTVMELAINAGPTLRFVKQ